MACYSCSSKKNLAYTMMSPTKVNMVQNCTQGPTDVYALKKRLECIMKITRNITTNAALGKLLSMINLNDFCRYDLAEINLMLSEYDTICP